MQIIIVFVSVITETKSRLKFYSKYGKIINNQRVLSDERADTVNRAQPSLKIMHAEIIEGVAQRRQIQKALMYLMEQPAIKTLDYDGTKAYERVQRLFADGGNWKRVHTLAVLDPNSKLMLSFINALERYDGYIDGGVLVKIVGIFMASKNFVMAEKVLLVIKTAKIKVNEDDMSVLFGYFTAELASLQRELSILVSDEYESGNVLFEMHTIRNLIIHSLAGYDTYSGKKRALNMQLPIGNWRVRDALYGSDHAYVLSKVEPKSVGQAIGLRWSCKGEEDDEEIKTKVLSDVEMSRMR